MYQREKINLVYKTVESEIETEIEECKTEINRLETEINSVSNFQESENNKENIIQNLKITLNNYFQKLEDYEIKLKIKHNTRVQQEIDQGIEQCQTEIKRLEKEINSFPSYPDI